MSKHIWQWDKKSSSPMMVVCIKCGKRVPLSEAISEIGCQGCPEKAVQKELFGDRREKDEG